MNYIIYKLALQRTKRLYRISKDFIRPLSVKTLRQEMIIASDNAVAKYENKEATLELARRFA